MHGSVPKFWSDAAGFPGTQRRSRNAESSPPLRAWSAGSIDCAPWRRAAFNGSAHAFQGAESTGEPMFRIIPTETGISFVGALLTLGLASTALASSPPATEIVSVDPPAASLA